MSTKLSQNPYSYVSHLECSLTGQHYSHDRMRGLSDAGAPLLVRYFLGKISEVISKDTFVQRSPDIWRWREFLPLPLEMEPVSLGEIETPLIAFRELPRVFIKDEGRLPTGSFKARGMAVAVSMAKHFNANGLVVPTAGNAGAAAAAYGAAAGIPTHVYAPIDTPTITLQEIELHGAQCHHVDGLIDRCGQLARKAASENGLHDLSTLAEPYRLEGKKTIGFELALQFNWSLPNVIYYPTGGGTGFIGMWKAFDELEAIGWIGSRRPRMVSVQTLGCNPIQQAFEAGHDDIMTAFAPVDTIVPGVRVPKPLGGRLILSVLRASGGHACAVSDDATIECRDQIARSEGINLCPEGAACHVAYLSDLETGAVNRDETVVIFNTANGLKWPMPELI